MLSDSSYFYDPINKQALAQLPRDSFIIVVKTEKVKRRDFKLASLSHSLFFFRRLLIQEQQSQLEHHKFWILLCGGKKDKLLFILKLVIDLPGDWL